MGEDSLPPGVLRGGVALPPELPLGGQQPLHSHRPPGVDPACRDPDLKSRGCSDADAQTVSQCDALTLTYIICDIDDLTSAPSPSLNPSANLELVLWNTQALSTPARNLSAVSLSSVTITSVCPDPYLIIIKINNDNAINGWDNMGTSESPKMLEFLEEYSPDP